MAFLFSYPSDRLFASERTKYSLHSFDGMFLSVVVATRLIIFWIDGFVNGRPW